MMTDEAANPTSSSSLSSTTVANNPFDEQIDKLENSLKSFIGIYNFDMIENRTNPEQNKKQALSLKLTNDLITNELLENARNLEILFLNYRHEIMKNAPEQIVEEEIEFLKAELVRKNELLNRAKEEIARHLSSMPSN